MQSQKRSRQSLLSRARKSLSSRVVAFGAAYSQAARRHNTPESDRGSRRTGKSARAAAGVGRDARVYCSAWRWRRRRRWKGHSRLLLGYDDARRRCRALVATRPRVRLYTVLFHWRCRARCSQPRGTSSRCLSGAKYC